jgi:hypothetical protein
MGQGCEVVSMRDVSGLKLASRSADCAAEFDGGLDDSHNQSRASDSPLASE